MSIGMDVNLYSSVITKTGQKWVKLVKKAASNNREDRARPESIHKSSGMELFTKEKSDNSFAADAGAYGQAWAEKYKGDKYTLPTFNEMVLGLFEWYEAQMAVKMKDKSPATQRKIVIACKLTWNRLALALKI